jgi:hypothetical protein
VVVATRRKITTPATLRLGINYEFIHLIVKIACTACVWRDGRVATVVQFREDAKDQSGSPPIESVLLQSVSLIPLPSDRSLECVAAFDRVRGEVHRGLWGTLERIVTREGGYLTNDDPGLSRKRRDASFHKSMVTGADEAFSTAAHDLIFVCMEGGQMLVKTRCNIVAHAMIKSRGFGFRPTDSMGARLFGGCAMISSALRIMSVWIDHDDDGMGVGEVERALSMGATLCALVARRYE